jgi:thymidylate synthase (FAD)
MGSLIDPRFRVDALNWTMAPEQLVWQAMHQDYYEGSVLDCVVPDAQKAGRLVVKHLLAGERGHYGPLEHPSITLGVAGFPHSVMQQARTHRVGISFDVQSMRYTGQRICKAAEGEVDIEDVFYMRPVGEYRDRQGKKYTYTQVQRDTDLADCLLAARLYDEKLASGWAEEHARGMIPFDFRQNFVVTFNLRSALHFMDLRSKADAQPEIQAMCDLMWPVIHRWAPEIAIWYERTRLHKARLAP